MIQPILPPILGIMVSGILKTLLLDIVRGLTESFYRHYYYRHIKHNVGSVILRSGSRLDVYSFSHSAASI